MFETHYFFLNAFIIFHLSVSFLPPEEFQPAINVLTFIYVKKSLWFFKFPFKNIHGRPLRLADEVEVNLSGGPSLMAEYPLDGPGIDPGPVPCGCPEVPEPVTFEGPNPAYSHCYIIENLLY